MVGDTRRKAFLHSKLHWNWKSLLGIQTMRNGYLSAMNTGVGKMGVQDQDSYYGRGWLNPWRQLRKLAEVGVLAGIAQDAVEDEIDVRDKAGGTMADRNRLDRFDKDVRSLSLLLIVVEFALQVLTCEIKGCLQSL